MLVEMVLTGKVKDVKPEAADVLFRAKAARPVYQTRELTPEVAPQVTPEVEISERTGKPKRRYKRRDLRAED